MLYSILIKVHIGIAMLSLLLGILNFCVNRKSPIHRYIGMIWILATLFTVFSSFIIREMNNNQFSILHLFSVWTFLVVMLGLFMLKKKRYDIHGKMMLSVISGTLFAGLFSVLTSERYWRPLSEYFGQLF